VILLQDISLVVVAIVVAVTASCKELTADQVTRQSHAHLGWLILLGAFDPCRHATGVALVHANQLRC
jgi:hypothetical protein